MLVRRNLVQQSHNPQPLHRDHMTVFDTHILVLPGGRVRLERAINARLGMNLKLYVTLLSEPFNKPHTMLS